MSASTFNIKGDATRPSRATYDDDTLMLALDTKGASVKARKEAKKYRTRNRQVLRTRLAPLLSEKLKLIAEIPRLSASEVLGVENEDDVQLDIPWGELKGGLDPSSGGVPLDRAQRKKKQVETVSWWARKALDHIRKADTTGRRHVVVEFCAGGGHLGLVFAYLNPDVDVVLVDYKKKSIENAVARMEEMGLTNVEAYCGRIEDFIATGREFTLGLGLHACGPASDAIMQACIDTNASYVVAPCCYGFIQSAVEEQVTKRLQPKQEESTGDVEHQISDHVTPGAHHPASTAEAAQVTYPRSRTFVNEPLGMSEALYHVASGFSDGTYWQNDNRHEELSTLARECMGCIDADRSLCAEERGYKCTVASMCEDGRGSGLKNQILIGLAGPSLAAS